MIIRDVGPDAVSRMTRVDLSTVSEEPPSLIEPFDFDACRCGVSSFTGAPPWELHTAGDEMLHILGGACRLTVRQGGEMIVRDLRAGDLAVVPRDCWHRNDAADGVTMLWITPRQGNRHSWEAPDG